MSVFLRLCSLFVFFFSVISAVFCLFGDLAVWVFRIFTRLVYQGSRYRQYVVGKGVYCEGTMAVMRETSSYHSQ